MLRQGLAGLRTDHAPARAFRFRFVARGEPTNTLVTSAVYSLKRCHPSVGVIVVDANDVPTLARTQFHDAGEFEVIHVVPEMDGVAKAVGRGSRRHLFYWRHSPQLIDALPQVDQFDVHSDADIIFLRPFDLRALLGPLEQGRIAAAIDESTLDYYQTVQALAPASGAQGGPLLQGGLVFRNPADDGGFYTRFWELAEQVAASGQLSDLPWDDMSILSMLLTQGGPLWERLLILGHEWNFISDANKDPGVFGGSRLCF
jgi:hypothetical protein